MILIKQEYIGINKLLLQVLIILRNDYINTLKQAQLEPKDNTSFVNFISEMVYESMKDYIRIIERLTEE